MVGKVIKLEYVDSYTGQNGELFNFAVLIENDKTPYFVSVKDKDKPGITVGDDLDFTVVEYDKSEDKKQHKRASIGGKQVDLIKIKKNQQNKGGFSGGGGGGNQKRYPKTYDEYVNELAWQTQQHTINFFCHRTTLDPISKFQEYYDLFYKVAFEKLRNDK